MSTVKKVPQRQCIGCGEMKNKRELIRVLKDAIDAGRKVVPLEQVEAEHVSKVVERCHGNISRAAELLGITRQTLYAKIKKR